jgi:phosphate transport system substrate-binding protein
MEFALRNNLASASVRNRAGKFVQASASGLSFAAEFGTREFPADLRGSIADAPGLLSYPICSLTWLLVPSRIDDGFRRAAAKQLLDWVLGGGQQQVVDAGLGRLPTELIARETRQIGLIQ